MSTPGQRIRYHRKRLGLTQEELGKIVGVQKAAVQKWENGIVVNLKRSTQQILAETFHVSIDELFSETATPVDCQKWEEQYNHNGALSVRSRILDEVNGAFGDGADRVLDHFDQLNDTGKKKAVEAIEDLAAIDKYRKDAEYCSFHSQRP